MINSGILQVSIDSLRIDHTRTKVRLATISTKWSIAPCKVLCTIVALTYCHVGTGIALDSECQADLLRPRYRYHGLLLLR